MKKDSNPIRPSENHDDHVGMECEVNAMEKEQSAQEDEDEMIMRAIDEADGQERVDRREEQGPEVQAPPQPFADASGEAVRTRTLRRPGQPSKR